MARRLPVLPVLVWFALVAVGVYWLQDKQIAKLQYARPYRVSLALPQIVERNADGTRPAEEELPQLVKVMTLGYDEVFASILWLRAIQAFGARLQHIRENPAELRAIKNVFDAIAELDPRFVEAYRFGNFVIGDEGGDQAAALRLIDKGIVHNYRRAYVLPYEAIFVCINKLKDYKRGLYYVRLALRCRDCPDYVARIGNYIIAKKGNYEIALERWIRDDLIAHANNQKYVYEITRSQINQVVNEWHFSILNAAMDRYFERRRDWPARLEQLAEEDLVGKVRQVDGPRLMQLLDGAEKARFPANEAVDLIMGTKDRPGCIIESNRLPLDLRSEPYLLLDEAVIPVQKRPTIVERQARRRQTEGALFAIRRRLKLSRDEKGQWPARLADLPEMQPGERQEFWPQDPVGMPWKYDPRTGAVGSYVFPEL